RSDDIKVEHSQDAGTSKDEIGELHDTLFQTPGIISSVTSEYFDTPEFRSPTGEADLEIYKRRVEVANEDQNEARQNLVPSAEGFMSPDSEEHFNEFEYVNEIDEEFLSELDTVGDFSVGDAGVSHHTDIVHNETRDTQLSSLREDVKTAEVEQDNDIPVLEERSLEDIDTGFKQLREGDDVSDVILPSTIKDQLVSEESKDHVEVNEARSLEDIDVASEKISKDNQGELPEKLDTEDASVKIEANEVGPAKLNESFDVSTSVEEVSRSPVDKPENVSNSSSSNKEKTHSRKSSSSSSSSSSDSD
ncbi:dentin sialophosphoprotein-like, partial [Trifolium medium]|nr:dentin sialophosphoprotein-like [Trifolium medium]